MNSIANVLGCLILIVGLSACSRPQDQKPIEITTRPAAMPELVLPNADSVKTRSVEWIIITEENYQEVFDKLKAQGNSVALFGLTGKGYENLSLNINDLRTYIQQQNSIILAYRNYYIRSQSVISNSVVLQ